MYENKVGSATAAMMVIVMMMMVMIMMMIIMMELVKYDNNISFASTS